MRRFLALGFIVILALGFWGCSDLEVKPDDIYKDTSKLIQADYYSDAGGFGSITQYYWVLKFENGMVITLDLCFQNNKPMSFQIGTTYEIYQSSTSQYRWKVRKADDGSK